MFLSAQGPHMSLGFRPNTQVQLSNIHTVQNEGETYANRDLFSRTRREINALRSQNFGLISVFMAESMSPLQTEWLGVTHPLPESSGSGGFSSSPSTLTQLKDGIVTPEVEASMFGDAWAARWAFDPSNPPATVPSRDIALARRIRGERDRGDVPAPPSNVTSTKPATAPSHSSSNSSFGGTNTGASGLPRFQRPTGVGLSPSAHPPSGPASATAAEGDGTTSTSSLQSSDASAGSTDAPGTRKVRFRPGTVALAEIKRAQPDVAPLIKRLPFQRLIRELFQDIGGDYVVQGAAIAALQEAAEAFLISFMEDANLAAIKEKTVTVLPEHMRQAMRTRAAAAGKTIPDGPISSANILRLINGMEMKDDNQDASGGEESDEGDDDDPDSDERDSDGDSDHEEDKSGPVVARGVSAATTSSPPNPPMLQGLIPSAVTAYIGEKLMEYLLKNLESQDTPLQSNYSSSADSSLPVIVVIEDLRATLKIPDSVPLKIIAQFVRAHIVVSVLQSTIAELILFFVRIAEEV
jgi:histone H3